MTVITRLSIGENDPTKTNSAINQMAEYIDLFAGSWTDYTPTISASTGTLTTASASGRYKVIGKTVFVELAGTITTNGTGATRIDMSLPVSAVASKQYAIIGVSGGKAIQGIIGGSAANAVNIRFYDSTYPGADGATLVLSGVYEAA